VARILLTGMSGTGKSSALAALARRGYRVVDTDEGELSEWVPDPAGPGGGEWLWRERPMTQLLAEPETGTLFVAGCVRNQGRFYDRFDAVVLLSAPPPVILERIATRTNNDYGKAPEERRLIEEQLRAVEPLLRRGCSHELDASRPLEQVVAELVTIAEGRVP